jgi:hypothetical protein
MNLEGMVQTAVGFIPEKDLEIKQTKEDAGQSWIIAQECVYVGSDEKFKEHVGKQVRRDVWVVIKYGLQMTGDQGA